MMPDSPTAAFDRFISSQMRSTLVDCGESTKI